MANKYNIGFIQRRRNDEYIASCGCGTVKLLGSLGWRESNSLRATCEKCGNQNLKQFVETVLNEDYKLLEYKKKNFAIITPSEMQDLIKEGNELSHCVASYVDSIVTNKCKILLLRNPKEIDKPIATIEVRGDNVRQARGYANRKLKKEEVDFVAEWAEKKDSD